jgi:hypothetical protein
LDVQNRTFGNTVEDCPLTGAPLSDMGIRTRVTEAGLLVGWPAASIVAIRNRPCRVAAAEADALPRAEIF